ncbi:hypothetical protein T484DRAFT_1647967, partial [Baffinella frigidus]
TINNQQSTINNQQSTINNQQSTINNQQSTINHQPPTTEHNPQPTIHNPQPTTHNPQPTTHNPQPTTHNPQLTTHKPQAIIHQPSPIAHQPHPINQTINHTPGDPRRVPCLAREVCSEEHAENDQKHYFSGNENYCTDALLLLVRPNCVVNFDARKSSCPQLKPVNHQPYSRGSSESAVSRTGSVCRRAWRVRCS